MDDIREEEVRRLLTRCRAALEEIRDGGWRTIAMAEAIAEVALEEVERITEESPSEQEV